jgi:hypothetical protein
LNILIFHRIPYHRINYHLSIDHSQHDVTYIGTAKHLADLPHHIRFKAIERPGTLPLVNEVMDAIQAHDLHPEMLIAQSEFEMLDAATVREQLGIHGTTVNEVKKLRDKEQVRRLIAETGIRQPRRAALSKVVREQHTRWEGKTALVDLRDGGDVHSPDVRLFNSPEELMYALKVRNTGIERLDCDQPRLEQFEAEELVDGKIMHYDGLINEGRVAIMIGSMYVGDCLSYVAGNPLGSVQVDLSSADQLWVQTVVEAIGIRHGMFHLEAVIGDSGRVFLDFANRAGGAKVVETFRMATGVNLVTADLATQMGEEIAIKSRRKPKKFGWFVFPGHHLPDGCCRISGHHGYVDHPMMIRCEMLKKSTPLPRHVTYRSAAVPMSGIVGGSSSDEMVNWIRKMFKEVRIRPPEKSRNFP